MKTAGFVKHAAETTVKTAKKETDELGEIATDAVKEIMEGLVVQGLKELSRKDKKRK